VELPAAPAISPITEADPVDEQDMLATAMTAAGVSNCIDFSSAYDLLDNLPMIDEPAVHEALAASASTVVASQSCPLIVPLLSATTGNQVPSTVFSSSVPSASSTANATLLSTAALVSHSITTDAPLQASALTMNDAEAEAQAVIDLTSDAVPIFVPSTAEPFSNILVPNFIPPPLNTHELAMNVFEQTVVPLILAMPGANSVIRLALIRAAYSRSVYAWMLRIPSPTLAEIELFLHNLLVSLGMNDWVAAAQAALHF
jgi:hypothetical protein